MKYEININLEMLKMGAPREELVTWIQPTRICLNVDIGDETDLLEFLALQAADLLGLESEPVFRALERRERIGSTALGNGFAIPHARLNGLSRTVTVFVRINESIDCESPDGHPARNFLAIMAGSDGSHDDQLTLLTLINKVVTSKEFRTNLDAAQDVESVTSCFEEELIKLRLK